MGSLALPIPLVLLVLLVPVQLSPARWLQRVFG